MAPYIHQFTDIERILLEKCYPLFDYAESEKDVRNVVESVDHLIECFGKLYVQCYNKHWDLRFLFLRKCKEKRQIFGKNTVSSK